MTWTPIRRRDYLMVKAVEAHGLLGAAEVIMAARQSHPEWDMDEFRTWPEWEADS